MFKKILFLGLISGLLAGIASLVYANVYYSALGTDFSQVAKPTGIMIISLVAGIMATLGYYLSTKWLKSYGELIFNLVFVVLTFASILGPFATKLPLTIEMPELFPGLTVPMHFFPALAWFTLKPLFIRPGKRSIYEVV
jgi:magnesium-transporting ATPase (P-type)